MSRLPTPGGDDGTWGGILNDFLGVEHNADGTQKTLGIAKGGTGGIDAATARANLGAISGSDSRLTDTRTPTDGSVTDAKIASNAAISVSKLAPGSNGEVLTTSGGAATWGSTPAPSGVVLTDSLFFNVKDHGAVGDGSTNDTAAIQATITAAGSTGITYFPAGTYLINATLSLPSGATLRGAGRFAATIKLANAANVTMLSAVNDAVGVTVEDLGLDGNKASQTSDGIGVSLPFSGIGCVDCSVRRCYIQNTYSWAIYGGTVSTRIRIEDNYITGTRGTSIIVGEASQGLIQRNHVFNAMTAGNVSSNDAAIYLIFNCTDTVVDQNVIKNAGTTTGCYGILLSAGGGAGAASGATITGNVLDTVADHGIFVNNNGTPISEVVINDNIVKNAGSVEPSGSGIIVVDGGAGITDVVVNGNNVFSAGGYGIEVALASKVVISNNVVRNCSDPGLYVAVNGFTCSGNYSNNTAGGFGIELNGCANGTVVGNTCELNGFGGIGIDGPFASYLTITGNQCISNGALGGGDPWEYAGIVLNTDTAAQYCTISGNTCTDTQNVKTQTYGIYETNGNNNFIHGNDVRNNKTTAIATSGAATLVRNNPGYNPVGSVVVSVPSSGAAVTAATFDRVFYVTAAAGGCTMAIQGGPSVVVPASGMGAVRLPAGQTVTPTYTNAPTWVVEGE